MGRELVDSFPVARAVFDEADRALGFSLSELCFSGPEEALKLTENTQPALLTVSVAAYRVLEEKGIRPDFVAGHSLGEYSALVAAGALQFADARAPGAATRPSTCRRRCRRRRAPWPRSWACVPGRWRRSAAKRPKGEVVAPANLNSPEQTVISGHAAAVKRAVEQASASGAKRAVMLRGFRALSQRADAARRRSAWRRICAQRTFAPLRIPLVTNVDAGIITSGEEAREALVRQVTLPVRWEESMRELIEEGTTTFVEVGPGRVLSGLLRQIERSVHCVNVEDSKSLQTALERLVQAQGESAEAS